MKKGISVILGFAVGLAAVVFGQTIVQRPRFPQTGMSYVGIGDAFPSDPWGTEFFIDVNGAGDSGPIFGMYDEVNTDWDRMLAATVAGVVTFADGSNLMFTNPLTSTIFDLETDAARIYGIGGRGTVIDIDHGLTTLVSLTPTLEANDNANDQRNVLLIDVDIPDGSAGLFNAINIDGVTDDANTLDSAIFIEGGWDSAITITERGSAATANPLAGTIWIFMDDSVDYSGGGGVDCWLIARDAGGTNNVLFQLVLNGPCQ